MPRHFRRGHNADHNFLECKFTIFRHPHPTFFIFYDNGGGSDAASFFIPATATLLLPSGRREIANNVSNTLEKFLLNIVRPLNNGVIFALVKCFAILALILILVRLPDEPDANESDDCAAYAFSPGGEAYDPLCLDECLNESGERPGSQHQ